MGRAGSLAWAHDALLPRAPGGLGSGAALALLVHAALLLALTTAVDWRTHSPPEAFSAELWSSVPQTAAPAPELPAPAPVPAPPSPPPQPAPQPAPVRSTPTTSPLVEPDIATERAEQQKAEAAKKKAEKAKEEEITRERAARDAIAEDARLAKLREENLKRMMGQAGTASGRSGAATQDAGPSATYASAVAARIRRELVFPGNVPDTAEAEVLVRAAASGTIIARQLSKPSGYKDWDEAVVKAIDKTGTLPRDADGRVPGALTLVFRRKE